jgi:hypothetical protein
MYDCDIEPGQGELEKNPWLIPPFLVKFPCDVERDIGEWYYVNALESSHAVGYANVEDYITVEVGILTTTGEHDTFKELVAQWKEETWFVSSIKKRVSHLAYLQIIGFGRAAIPWILAELRREPDYWYPALEAITRMNLLPHADNMNQLREAWLAWGEENGYIG